jgi:hypothetical protein
MRKFFLLPALILMCLGASPPASAQERIYAGCKVKDFSNGVLYFACYSEHFGRALSVFRNVTEADIITIAPDDNFSYGRTGAYYVIVRMKK